MTSFKLNEGKFNFWDLLHWLNFIKLFICYREKMIKCNGIGSVDTKKLRFCSKTRASPPLILRALELFEKFLARSWFKFVFIRIHIVVSLGSEKNLEASSLLLIYCVTKRYKCIRLLKSFPESSHINWEKYLLKKSAKSI
jgi:hypothetical protein